MCGGVVAQSFHIVTRTARVGGGWEPCGRARIGVLVLCAPMTNCACGMYPDEELPPWTNGTSADHQAYGRTVTNRPSALPNGMDGPVDPKPESESASGKSIHLSGPGRRTAAS